MYRSFLFLPLFLFFIATFSTAEDDGSLIGYRYLGPSDILIGGDPDELFVLEQDALQLRKVRVDGKSNPTVLPIPIRPTRMSFFPDKKRLAIVGNGPLGKLLIVDAAEMKVEQIVSVGHSPSDVSVFQEGNNAKIYVSNRFEGTISVLETTKELSTIKEAARWNAGREPIALEVSSDGKYLVAIGQIPEDPALDPDIGARVRVFDTATGECSTIRLRNGAMNLRDVALSSDGRYAFITGIVGHFEQLPSQVSGGWTNENAVFVVDVHAKEDANIFYVDDYAIGAGNPWGISLSDDARFLIVTHAGSCDISMLTMRKILDILDNRPGSKGESTTPPLPQTDRTLPLQMRIPVGLKGVRHAVMSQGRIFATAYFEDCILQITPEFDEPVPYVPGLVIGMDPLDWPTKRAGKRFTDENAVAENASLRFNPLPRFDLMKGAKFHRSFARLGPEPIWNNVRHGEVLFHDAMLCFEHWQSCVTCHPDARSDTLNWDLFNDGQGNPKNSKSMLLSHETPPSMATGVRKSAELAVRKGFETILFVHISEEDACDVDAYLRALEPVSSPKLVYAKNGTTSLSDAAKRGKRLFDGAAGCAICHPAPLFTDLNRHDVGTLSAGDYEPFYDTPTLIECWRTAPYLHDGRYKSMKELIKDGKHVNTNGRIDKLTEAEIDDLIEYVLSL